MRIKKYTVSDLYAIASINRIIRNYRMMKKLLFIFILFSGTLFAQPPISIHALYSSSGGGGACGGGTPGSSDTWAKKTNFGGTGRRYGTAVSISNIIYFGTGEDTATSQAVQDWWKYDPCANTWTQKANFPTKTELCFSFAVGGYAYVGGGIDIGINLKDSMWRYDPVGNSWVNKKKYGGGVTVEAMGFTDGTDGFVAGGYYAFMFGSVNATCYRYDVGADTWTARASMPNPRYGAASYTIGTKGYVVCGFYFTYEATNYEFNFSGNSWSAKAAFSGAARANVTGFNIGSNNGYVGCGNDGSVNYSDFFAYSQSGNSWASKAAYGGGAGYGMAAAATATLGFYITGTKVGNDKDIYGYTP